MHPEAMLTMKNITKNKNEWISFRIAALEKLEKAKNSFDLTGFFNKKLPEKEKSDHNSKPRPKIFTPVGSNRNSSLSPRKNFDLSLAINSKRKTSANLYESKEKRIKKYKYLPKKEPPPNFWLKYRKKVHTRRISHEYTSQIVYTLPY